MTLKEEKSSNAFFNDSAILFIYGITFLTYCAGFWLRDQHYIMLLPIICFIGYDYWFTYKNKKAWGDAGRCKTVTPLRMVYKLHIARVNVQMHVKGL